jgi:hypothetical protein
VGASGPTHLSAERVGELVGVGRVNGSVAGYLSSHHEYHPYTNPSSCRLYIYRRGGDPCPGTCLCLGRLHTST